MDKWAKIDRKNHAAQGRVRHRDRKGADDGKAADAAQSEAARAAIPTSRLGNQGIQRTLNDVSQPRVIAAALTGHGNLRLQSFTRGGASSDPLEHEAERVADRALGSPRNLTKSGAGVPISPITATAGETVQAAPQSVARTLASPGNPLPPAQRQDMEHHFGIDFGAVRVHTDTPAGHSAGELNALAYTAGNHVVFGAGQFAPGTSAGRHLLAHELTHVVQQAGGVRMRGEHGPEGDAPRSAPPQPASHTTGAVVQRAIRPEDVASEMVGQEFELASGFSSGGHSLVKGDVVTALMWTNTDANVLVMVMVSVGIFTIPVMLSVPKTLLRPVRPSGARLDPYSTGIAGQARAVEKNEADLVGKTGAEKVRLEGLLATRRAVLNRKLIQETMFNRFDPIIAREVAAANTAHGLTGAAALDPDLVKAMLFQESELGTSGTHMEVPPSHPVKSRFNLGQVIDSSGMALLTMLEREQPAWVAAFFLSTLRSDLSSAQTRKATLEKKATRSTAEATELAELRRLSGQNWEVFIWGYKAPGKSVGFADAVNGFFASSSPAKSMDYEFWIHMAVMWLFEKKTPKRTWAETIKAYNGSGKRAEHYRDAVLKRAADAETAAKAGTPFEPTR